MSAQLIACLLELYSGLDSTAGQYPTMWNPLEARTLQLISCGRSLRTGGPSHRLFPRTLKTKNENFNIKNKRLCYYLFTKMCLPIICIPHMSGSSTPSLIDLSIAHFIIFLRKYVELFVIEIKPNKNE